MLKLKNIIPLIFICFMSVLKAQDSCKLLATKAMNTDNINEAIQIWSQIINANCPDKVMAYNNIGMIYFQGLEEYDSAVVNFDKGILFDSLNIPLWINKGSVLSRLEKHDEAILCIEKAIKIDPKNALSYAHLAGIYANKKDFDKAFELSDKALTIDSSNYQILYDRYQMYCAVGDDESQLKYLTLLANRNPQSPKAQEALGYFYYQNKDDLKAIEYYNKAIGLNPKDFRLYVARGISYGREGEIAKQMEDYNKSIQIQPNYLAYYNRGRVYLKDEQFELAIQDNDKVIELAPKFSEAYLNKGNALFRQGKYQEAKDCYNKGLNTNPPPNAKGKLTYQLKQVNELLKK